MSPAQPPVWEMTIPVISTRHMPGTDALAHHKETPVAHYPEGCFLYLPEKSANEHWLNPIIEWAQSRGFDGWIRFDADADPVPGLPTYEW